MKTIISAAALALAAPAHAGGFELRFIPNATQAARMDAGLEAINSDQAQTSVRLIEPPSAFKKRGSFSIAVFNDSQLPFNFGPENVRIRTVDGLSVAVVSYDQLIKEEKNRQMWAAVATGLGAMANSIQASNAGHYSGSSSFWGRAGNTSVRGGSNFSGYNHAAAYQAQTSARLENEARFANLSANADAAVAALQVNLRTTTIDPGSSFGGALMFELPKAARKSKAPVELLVEVDTGSEKHEFRMTATKGK